MSRYFWSSQTSPVQDRAPKILFFSLALFEARYLWVSKIQVTSERLSNLSVNCGAPAIRNPSGPPHHAPRLRRKNAKFWKDEKYCNLCGGGCKKSAKNAKFCHPCREGWKKVQNSATCAEDSAPQRGGDGVLQIGIRHRHPFLFEDKIFI